MDQTFMEPVEPSNVARWIGDSWRDIEKSIGLRDSVQRHIKMRSLELRDVLCRLLTTTQYLHE